MRSSIGQTKELLGSMGIRARKGLGQHFLIDRDILKYIIDAAELISTDNVVEVGPGLGILTEELVRNAGRVIAIELDSKLAAALERISGVTVINQDVMQVNPSRLFGPGETSYKVVANLPYYITSPILRHFLEAELKPELMVIMVQREVAENMVAGAGKMSILSVSVQLYGKPVIIQNVPADAFYPRPKVESAVVRIDVYNQPAVDMEDITLFFTIVKAGFGARRKQLHNALAGRLGLSSQVAVELLDKAGIDHMRRAQTLTLQEWSALTRIIGEQGVNR